MSALRTLPALDLDDSVWLLSSFCALHRTNFDAALFAQRYPAPVARESLTLAADELGLKLEQKHAPLAAALAWQLPLAIALRDASTQATSWALVLNADEQNVVLIERGGTTPIAMPFAEVDARYQGLAVSMRPKAAESVDPDGLDARSAHFGLHWFIPELKKHKRV